MDSNNRYEDNFIKTINEFIYCFIDFFLTNIHLSVYAGLPPSAVYAGNDSDGSPIYIGRAFFEGNQLPCKVLPSKNAAYVSYAGKEHFVSNYEVIDEILLSTLQFLMNLIIKGIIWSWIYMGIIRTWSCSIWCCNRW